MSKRIDDLRSSIREIRSRQKSYAEFFPQFALTIAEQFSDYLGEANLVRPTSNDGPFDFHTEYGTSGQGIEEGYYRVPLMINIGSLEDGREIAIRFRLFCSVNGTTLNVRAEKAHPVSFEVDQISERLCPYLFDFLQTELSSETYFHDREDDYQDTDIGFVHTPDNA